MSEFKAIIQKYNLQEKVDEITDYIFSKQEIDPKEFATLFAMDAKDAITFLHTIHRGLKFKEEYLDKQDDN
ncbi:hypothetical protein H6504_01615 [Candidatus Woesearchaeota archaeon]|nr:hypothetical protein [Candidatus Woesearchaeota archaeon]